MLLSVVVDDIVVDVVVAVVVVAAGVIVGGSDVDINQRRPTCRLF